MSLAKIFSYIGLGIVGALIICVIVLACVPTKIMPTVKQPDQIIVYNGDTDYYIANKDSSDETQKNNYDKILNAFNSSGNYSILNTIFLGVAGSKFQINYVGSGSSESKTVSTLKSEYEYVVELTFNEPYILTDAYGNEYTANSPNANPTNIKIASIAMGISNTGAQETVIYAYSESGSNYWTYVTFVNTSNLYNVCEDIEGYHA